MKKSVGIFAAVAAAAIAFYAMPSAAQQMSGFYVRGDLGGAFGQDTTFKDTNPSASNAVLGNFTVPSSTGNSVIFGGGVGYHFSPIIRADVTLDYLPSLRASGHITPLPVTAPIAGNVDSLVALVNGYVDVNGLMPNTFGLFQPYLTAGIGFSRNSLGATSGGLTVGGVGVTYGVSGNTNTDLAWAVGAGVGYPVTQNLTVDFGYKYLSLGEMRTGTTATASAAGIIASGTVTQAKADLYVHTITLGVRYGF